MAKYVSTLMNAMPPVCKLPLFSYGSNGRIPLTEFIYSGLVYCKFYSNGSHGHGSDKVSDKRKTFRRCCIYLSATLPVGFTIQISLVE